MSLQVVYYNMEHRLITYPGIYPNRYVITEYGHVIEPKPYLSYIKVPFINQYGYLQIRIKNNQNQDTVPLIHRLVAWEWNCPNKNLSLTVDHLDGNKLNNHYSNLEWVTNEENHRRAYMKKFYKLSHDDAFKTLEEIHKVCHLLATIELTYSEICWAVGLCQLNENQAKGLCCDILNGLTWKDISSQYDLSRRQSRRRKYIPHDVKDDMYQQYLNGIPYEEIYKSFYKCDPLPKHFESFKRVMGRIIESHESSSTIM